MLANKAVNLLEKEIEDIVGEELIHTKDFIRKWTHTRIWLMSTVVFAQQQRFRLSAVAMQGNSPWLRSRQNAHAQASEHGLWQLQYDPGHGLSQFFLFERNESLWGAAARNA